MLFCDFHSKLKKLNRGLWVDVDRQNLIYDKDFPHAGLYYGDKFIMGVPHNYVPEYTISGVDTEKLELEGYPMGDVVNGSGKFLDKDFIENIKENDPTAFECRILAKGYRAILAHLVNKGYINKDRAEKEFGFTIEPSRMHFPRRYIDLGYGIK